MGSQLLVNASELSLWIPTLLPECAFHPPKRPSEQNNSIDLCWPQLKEFRGQRQIDGSHVISMSTVGCKRVPTCPIPFRQQQSDRQSTY